MLLYPAPSNLCMLTATPTIIGCKGSGLWIVIGRRIMNNALQACNPVTPAALLVSLSLTHTHAGDAYFMRQ